jgi:hypothetical protein
MIHSLHRLSLQYDTQFHTYGSVCAHVLADLLSKIRTHAIGNCTIADRQETLRKKTKFVECFTVNNIKICPPFSQLRELLQPKDQNMATSSSSADQTVGR